MMSAFLEGEGERFLGRLGFRGVACAWEVGITSLSRAQHIYIYVYMSL